MVRYLCVGSEEVINFRGYANLNSERTRVEGGSRVARMEPYPGRWDVWAKTEHEAAIRQQARVIQNNRKADYV